MPDQWPGHLAEDVAVLKARVTDVVFQLRSMASLVADHAVLVQTVEGLQGAIDLIRAELASMRETADRDRSHLEDELARRDRDLAEAERVRNSEKRATWLAVGALFVTAIGVGIAYAQLKSGAH